MRGLGYVLRLLRGESAKDVIESMPEEDYAQISSFVTELRSTGVNRAARRKIERKWKTVERGGKKRSSHI